CAAAAGVRRHRVSKPSPRTGADVSTEREGDSLGQERDSPYSCSMNEPLDIATDGPTQVWTINLHHLGNAITAKAFVEAFGAAVGEANADTAIRVVILTGAGKIFSAGGNVKEMAGRAGMFGVSALDQRRAYIDGVQRIPRALSRL